MQRVVRSTLVGLLTVAGLTACGDKITVPPPTTAPLDMTVSQVVVSPASVGINVGQSVTLAASVIAGNGVTNRTVTWSSSDATVATVTTAGVVAGVKAGVVSIIAASVADPTVRGAAAVTVGGGAANPPQVLITALTQGGTNQPINIAAAAGQIDVVLDVQTNGAQLRTVSATMNCSRTTTMTQTQTVAGPAGSDAAESAIPIVLSFPTNAFTVSSANVGVPRLNNGPCSLTASATTGATGSTPQTATTTTQLTLANQNGIVFNNSFTAVPNAEGVTPTITQANDQFGLPWRSGSVTVLAIPVIYGNIDGTAQTIASLNLMLPGASNTATVTLTAAPFSQTWSANASSGPRVVQSLAVGAGFEVNGQTPLPVTPTAQAIDANGNDFNLVVLAGGTNQSFRLDNQSPQAPLAFNIPARQGGWVNASYTFTGAGSGNGNGNVNVTTGSNNFVSCGDGPNVTAAPYVCVVQGGVSGIGANNAQITTNAGTNANMTYSFYVIPTASYTAASTANGTSTSASSCSTTGWTKISNAGDVTPASSSSNTAFVTRVFETDKLGNSRCSDLSVPVGLSTGLAGQPPVGQIVSVFNTGAGFSPANRGSFGVDRVVPTAVLIDPDATNPNAASANMVVGIGAPTPNFQVGLSDDASGFSALPISATVTRLALNNTTGQPSTVNSTFGCPIGGLSSGVCVAGNVGTTVPADAGSGQDFSGACLGCGYFTYTGTARDLARNTAPTLTRQVVIDRLAPTMGSIAVPATLTGGTSASFATSANDNLDLISSNFTLTYPASPTGNPVANLPIRSALAPFHAAFSGTLLPAQSFNLVAPVFIRTVNVTGGGNAPPNTTGFLPTTIAARVIDAGGNVSLVNPGGNGAGFSNIPAAAIGQQNLTNFSVAPAGQNVLAVMQTFAEANAVANISNCPAAGCAGGAAAANPTTVNLTAAASGAEGAAFQFTNPFTQVQFYYFDPASAEYILIGAATVPVVTDNATATVRTFTWTFPAWDPPAALPAGPVSIVAVGVNTAGDALASAVNANITLTNP